MPIFILDQYVLFIKMNSKSADNLALKTIAMPANTNANGDIFGGWLVSQMDIASCILAQQIANGRVATVAIDSMSFHHPVKVGDIVSCFCQLLKIGNSSMHIEVETWVNHHTTSAGKLVTTGTFVIVAIDEHGRPRIVPQASTCAT